MRDLPIDRLHAGTMNAAEAIRIAAGILRADATYFQEYGCAKASADFRQLAEVLDAHARGLSP